jgi:hypothetical protein
MIGEAMDVEDVVDSLRREAALALWATPRLRKVSVSIG